MNRLKFGRLPSIVVVVAAGASALLVIDGCSISSGGPSQPDSGSTAPDAGGTGALDSGGDASTPSDGGDAGSVGDSGGESDSRAEGDAVAVDAGSGGDAGLNQGALDGGGPATFYALVYPKTFGTLNPQTGAFVQIGPQQNGLAGGDLARSPGGTLYGLDSNRNLIIINPVSATSTIVGPLTANTGNGLDAFKFRQDGILFGVSFTDLYTIDPNTAQTTHIGSLGVLADPANDESIDLAFDANGNMFFTASTNETPSGANGPTGGTGTLYSVNAVSGLATKIGPIGFGVIGTEFARGTLYGFTTSSQVITIDTATGVGTVLSNETPQGVKVFAAAPTAGSGGASDAAPE